MAAIIRNANLRGVSISTVTAPLNNPVLSWWDFEEDSTGNTFSNANGGASFFSEQQTSVVTSPGGIDGRMLSTVGLVSNYNFAPIPDNLIYVETSDPLLPDFKTVNSLTMGGWFSMQPMSGMVDAIFSFNNASLVNGSGYTNGVYTEFPLNGGTGTLAVATITVSGGEVTSVVKSFPGASRTGTGYTVGDILSASLPGGSGFSIEVLSVSNSGVGGTVMDFGCGAINADIETGELSASVVYATIDGPSAGYASTLGTMAMSDPLALWVSTFDHLTGDLSLYVNGSFVSSFNVTDRTGPLAESGYVSNPSLGAIVIDDVFDGLSMAALDADAVFFIKDLAVSASDVTYLYNSGSGRTMAAFKAHLGL